MEKALLEPHTKRSDDTKNIEDGITFRGAIKELLPAVGLGYLFSIFERIGNVTNLYFMSKSNDPLIVAGIGFGNTWMNMVSIGLSMCFSSGLSTLVAQAYGAGRLQLCSYRLHRGLIVTILIFGIFLLSLLFFTPTLRLLKYEADLISITLSYAIVMIPSQLGEALFVLLRNFAAGFQVFNLPVYIQIVFTIAETIISYVLIYHLELGFTGLGICRGISEIGRTITLFYFLKRDKAFQGTLSWFQEESFAWLADQIKYQFHTGMVAYIDYLTFIIGEMVVASLGLIELDASFCFISAYLIFLTLPLSVSQPASSFMGMQSGRETPKKPKYISELPAV